MYRYVASPNERPISVKKSVSEGHPSGFTRARYESKYCLAGHVPNYELPKIGTRDNYLDKARNSEII